LIVIEVAALIIIGILLFELIIFCHEGGHFIAAKLSGVRVNEFALGMGPKLFQFTKGETTYSLRLLPIGGYCAMEGEDEQSEDPKAFGNKKVWKRIIIVCAGAFMNIVLGLLMMLIIVVQQPMYATTTVDAFPENSVTQQNGLKAGDRFLSIDGYDIYNSRDITFALATVQNYKAEVVVERNGETINLGEMEFATRTNEEGNKTLVLDFYVVPQERTFLSVLQQTWEQTVSVVRITWYSLIGLITGRFGFTALSGPIGIVSAISDVASAGLQINFLSAFNNILSVMMLITVNLGIVNMLPIPALDGGRLIFLIVEGIRRKPVPAKYEGIVHGVGFALLMVFMVVVAFSDIVRLFTGSGLG